MNEPAAVATPHVHHDVHHDAPGFWRAYVFSTDHKVIGIQYAITGLLFLLFGFSLMMLMRWNLAFPGKALPLLGKILGDTRMPGGSMLPEFYNQLGAMHGTIMVFLGVVPLAVGGFGNFVVPLQIGAPDMAFPRLNMFSYHAYFWGGVVMLGSFFAPGGAAQGGWTSYPPLSDILPTGQTLWILGMLFLITSSLLGAVNFITTIIQLRAPGLTFWRLPFFVVAAWVTGPFFGSRKRQRNWSVRCMPLVSISGHVFSPLLERVRSSNPSASIFFIFAPSSFAMLTFAPA